MKLGSIQQQPDEYLSYTIDYTDALTANDEISGATVVSIPEDASLTINRITTTKDSVRFWITGGTHAQRYQIEVTATTDEGRIFQDELSLMVREI